MQQWLSDALYCHLQQKSAATTPPHRGASFNASSTELTEAFLSRVATEAGDDVMRGEISAIFK